MTISNNFTCAACARQGPIKGSKHIHLFGRSRKVCAKCAALREEQKERDRANPSGSSR